MRGSVEPTRSNGLLCGMAVCIAYSRRTHTTGALTGGSGSWLPCITGKHARVCSDKRVLARYFHGTQHGKGEVHLSFELFIRCSHGTAPPRRAREAPSGACRSLCGTQRAVHGSVGHPSVWFVRNGTVECSQGTHRVIIGYSHGSAVHRRLGVGRRHAVQRMCVAPRRALLGGRAASHGGGLGLRCSPGTRRVLQG